MRTPRSIIGSTPLLLIILLGVGTCSALRAMEEVRTAGEIDDAFRDQRREAAAAFRVRSRSVAASKDPAYHLAAAQQFNLAREQFVSMNFINALDIAESAYRDFPYADAAPQIAHLLLRINAATGAPVQARRWLIDLWERYPGYGGIDTAMEEALAAAVVLRDRGMSIDMEAEDPRNALQVHDLRQVLAANNLFRFLSINGDRQTIAPVAQLGLARSLLAEGGKKKIFDARLAYDDFLLTYPEHPLVFEALIELAISHLVTYRGPRFDVGVVLDAAHIIDQAELYTQEDPKRVAIVRHFRSLIRRWQQDRDFYAAEWYRDHRKWEAARYYYNAVVRREASSEPGQRAAAALQDLPSDTIPEPAMGIIDWIRK